MNFRSRPHIENRQMVQYPGEGITLSGQTTFDLGNYDGYIYDSHLDFVNGISGSTYITLPYSASTDPVSGWTEHTVFKPGYFRVIPARKITFSGNTDVVESVYQPDVTSYVLGSLDSQGTVGWMAMSAATVTPYIFDTSVVSDAIIPLVGSNVSQSTKSVVLGGLDNIINTNSHYSSILGGSGNTISHQNSHIIGSNITSDSSGTTFVNNLTIKGKFLVHSDGNGGTIQSGLESGSNVGQYTQHSVSGSVIDVLVNTESNVGKTSSLLINSAISGRSETIWSYGQGSVTGKYLSIGYDSDDHVRNTNFSINGFYRNKNIITTGENVDGLVIDFVDNSNSRLYFTQNTDVIMMLAGGPTSSDGSLGLALNPDGTEIPTSTIQIGGTGTTGTFKYRDGNQQSGYVLTSDNDGNATWQLVTTSFTGNTSGNCITDLYVSNVYGCSPVTFHDTIITPDLWVDNNVNVVGSVSATTFYGDGSNLTGISTGGSYWTGGTGVDSIISLNQSHTASGDNSVVAGGQANSVIGNSSSIIGGQNNILNANGSVIIGGTNITGTTNDTVYVPYLNIGNLSDTTTGTTYSNLVIDSGGNVLKNNQFYIGVNFTVTGVTWDYVAPEQFRINSVDNPSGISYITLLNGSTYTLGNTINLYDTFQLSGVTNTGFLKLNSELI